VQLPHDARRRFEAIDVIDTSADAGVDLALQLPLPGLRGWSRVPAPERRVAKEQDQAGDEYGGGCAKKGQDLSIGSALGGLDFVASG